MLFLLDNRKRAEVQNPPRRVASNHFFVQNRLRNLPVHRRQQNRKTFGEADKAGSDRYLWRDNLYISPRV